MTTPSQPLGPVSDTQRRLRGAWTTRPRWLVATLLLAAFVAAVTSAAQLVNTHRRPAELLADARAVVPPRWVETSGSASKGSLLITLNEAIVEALAPAVLPKQAAVRYVMDHLVARHCKVRVSNVVLSTPSIEGRCGLAEITVNLHSADEPGQADTGQIGSLSVYATNAFDAQFLRSTLAAAAAFLLIAAPAVGLAFRLARRP